MPREPWTAFALLQQCVLPVASPPRTLAVVAHPDDESAGFGGQLQSLSASLTLVYLTDGAPRDMQDAVRLGFASAADYRAARARELGQALRTAGIDAAQVTKLGAVDKEAAASLPRLVFAVERLVAAQRPELVLTHAYEGGHPDHDAAAFVVHRAVERVASRGIAAPAIAEFAMYHRAEEGGWRWGFAPGARLSELGVVLDAPRRAAKEQLLACFVTQRGVLAGVPRDEERFRPAPRYDFSRAPCGARPLYEDFGWGLTAEGWCRHAREADVALASGVAWA